MYFREAHDVDEFVPRKVEQAVVLAHVLTSAELLARVVLSTRSAELVCSRTIAYECDRDVAMACN